MDGVQADVAKALLEASIAFLDQRATWLDEELGQVERAAWVEQQVLAPLEEANALAARLPPGRDAASVLELLKALWRATFAGEPCAPTDVLQPMIGFPLDDPGTAPSRPARRAPARRPAPKKPAKPAPRKPRPSKPRRRRGT
ncbi:MAG: hypothetical protein U0229_08280 [Anaeromyxobacter sp.]